MAARAKELKVVFRALALLCALAIVAIADARSAAAAPQSRSTTARRVVSLVPNVTEMLFAVGAGAQVIAVTSYDDFPAEVKSLPRVGALLDPDIERILALRPDLVIVYGSQTELEAQFGRAGIRVYSYKHGGIEDVLASIRDVAQLTGHRQNGEQVVRSLRTQLDAIRNRVRGHSRPRTMLVLGRDPGTLRGIYASGGVGFMHDVLDAAGGDDVFADIRRESVQPSNETILSRAPQVIIEVHAGEQPSGDVLQRERSVWNLLASVPAVRNNRIHSLYGSYLVAAGPRLGQAAEAFARALHPDVFQ
jgi:cobalamin transport system substrate-binding protein